MTDHRLTITRWRNVTDTEGAEDTLQWSWLVEQLSSKPVTFLGDREHPGWSPAEFSDQKRARAGCKRVWALCLDYDQGETRDAARKLWGGVAGMMHASRKCSTESPRFRVILPLRRPVSAFEFDALWMRVNAYCGGKLDRQARDPSRFWYLPGPKAGSEWWAESWEGPLLDPDEWLSRPAPVEPRPAVAPRRDPSEQTSVYERARAYVSKMPEAISGSGGHAATWDVAVVLAKGFRLNEEDTFLMLWNDYNPRCQPAWTEREIRHKAQQAQSARLPDGFIVDIARPWSAPEHRSRQPVPPPDDRWDGIIEDPPEWLHEPVEAKQEPVTESQHKPDPPRSAPSAVSRKTAIERYGLLSERQLLKLCWDRISSPAPEGGTPTGLSELDDAIGGFRRGNVTILGAKRSAGKTGMTILARDAATQCGHGFLMIAGEDAAAMYAARLMAKRAQIDALHIRDLRWRDDAEKADDFRRATQAVHDATDFPWFMPASGMLVEDMVKAIEELAKEIDIAVVSADYLQKIQAKRQFGEKRNLEVSYVASLLTNAIKKANAAGLLLSQLRRGGDDERPSLEALKETGDLEDGAEHVLLLWRQRKQNAPDERFIVVAKNKDGPDCIEDIPVQFDPLTASFGGGATTIDAAAMTDDDFDIPIADERPRAGY